MRKIEREITKNFARQGEMLVGPKSDINIIVKIRKRILKLKTRSQNFEMWGKLKGKLQKNLKDKEKHQLDQNKTYMPL